jgi:hypothetical protein
MQSRRHLPARFHSATIPSNKFANILASETDQKLDPDLSGSKKIKRPIRVYKKIIMLELPFVSKTVFLQYRQPY